MRSDEIEFFTEVGQGNLPFDSADDPRNIEQRSRRAEERLVVGIESEHVVPEMFADVKEVTRAAAKIENAQRRRAIEPQVLGALDVDVDPISDVFKAIDLRRAGPIRILV